MPLQTISMYRGRSPEARRLIADCVQEAVVCAGYPAIYTPLRGISRAISNRPNSSRFALLLSILDPQLVMLP